MDPVTRDTNAFVKSLASVLQAARERTQISKTELAARAGLSQPHIGYIEHGKRAPTVESLKRISIALGISAADLVAEAEALATANRM